MRRVLLLLVCSVLGWSAALRLASTGNAQKAVADTAGRESHLDSHPDSHAGSGAEPREGAQSGPAESTQTMAALLRQIYLRQDWKTDPNKPWLAPSITRGC